MARLFGIIGNRPDLTLRVLGLEAEALKAQAFGSPFAWGLGFYQGGEVLMRRRPLDERTELDLTQLAADVRADVLIGHVRKATVGVLRTENTHPFRYRQWLFAQTGTVSEFPQIREKLVASVPEFLRGGIRGDTDAEVVFHIFLTCLHDAGLLSDGAVEARRVREAVRSSLALVDTQTAEVGAPPSRLNVLVSNGDCLIAVHRSETMSLRVFGGASDVEQLVANDAQLRKRAPELMRLHFAMAASDFDVPPPDGRWKTVTDRAIITMSRGVDPRIEVL
jgi:glutamine amidotransferase